MSFIIINPLIAVSRGSGYKFFVTLYDEPAIRIEHYTCKNGLSAGGPDRTIHANRYSQPVSRIYICLKIENKILFVIISMVVL